MHSRLRLLATLGLLALAAGCDGLGPVDCPAVISLGVEVEIRDATTDAFIAHRATGFVTEGSFRDSLRLIGSLRVGEEIVGTRKGGADERAGTYAVEITAPGYAPWVRSGIRVRDGECGVRTVRLVARLQPAAP